MWPDAPDKMHVQLAGVGTPPPCYTEKNLQLLRMSEKQKLLDKKGSLK